MHTDGQGPGAAHRRTAGPRHRIRTAPLALVAAAALAAAAPAAFGHEALSGWSYPPHCCSGHDCYEIAAGDIEPAAGGWRIKATGEVWTNNRTNVSPDGRHHRCSVAGRREAPTLCLWVPAGT